MSCVGRSHGYIVLPNWIYLGNWFICLGVVSSGFQGRIIMPDRARENQFRDKAESYFKSLGCNYATGPISWDDKNLMAQLHMAKLFPSNVDYRSKVEEEADKLLTHHRTPKGLLFNKEISKWGSLRYAANWAFFLFGAARLEPRLERSGEYI